jgi:sugar phosphate isomerase/epimerase
LSPETASGIGFETIQFAAKFHGPKVSGPDLVYAAQRAGFGWMAFDRHTLALESRSDRGLEELARVCTAAGMLCRSVQSLRITGDADETAAGVEQLAAQVRALRPDVVPLILLTEPTNAVLDVVRVAVDQVSQAWPGIRFGLEFGPVFPIEDLKSARRAALALGHPGVGLVVDSWHVFNGTTSWSDMQTLEATEIVLVQLNDHGPLTGTSLDEAKNHRLLPGGGVFPIQDLLDLLYDTGYRGLISVEVISAALRAEGPDRFAVVAFDSLRRFRYGPSTLVEGHPDPQEPQVPRAL